MLLIIKAIYVDIAIKIIPTEHVNTVLILLEKGV